MDLIEFIETSLSFSRLFSLSQACQNNWHVCYIRERESIACNTLYNVERVTYIVISRSTDFAITNVSNITWARYRNTHSMHDSDYYTSLAINLRGNITG